MNALINHAVIQQIQPDYAHQPLAIFLMGANGSGKSTLRNYLNLSEIQVNLDPDLLNRLFKAKYPDNYLIVSAKQALKLFYEGLEAGLNICLETTLAGQGTLQRIYQAQKKGYYLIGYFVGLNQVELNLQRIAERVARGGHDIPTETVKRRYQESLDHLLQLKACFQTLHVIDNSESFYQLQWSLYDQKIIYHTTQLENWAENLIA